MSQVDSPPPAVSKSSWRRFRLPIIALAVAAVGIVLLQLVPIEGLDNGLRLTGSFLVIVAAAVTIGGWFFVASGARGRDRIVVAGLLVAALLSAGLSVRRVEFSGDMVPTFDFRWRTDRDVLLEEHRTRQRAEEAAPQPCGPAEPPSIADDLAARTARTARVSDENQAAAAQAASDCLEFRGPRRDGIVDGGPKLAREWTSVPPTMIWRQPVGGGYASFVVLGGTLATIEQRRDKEAVVAYEVDSGRERWVHEYPALFHENAGGDGPRATPTFHDGRLYALGATGVLSCLDFATGKPAWSLNILEENRSGNIDWGMSGSPLVVDQTIVVNPGNQKGTDHSRAVVAYSLADGKRQWAGGETKSSYASPMLVTLAGVRQVLIFDAFGLVGHDATDGRVLWSVPWKSDFEINASQPIVVNDTQVLIGSASGSALIEIGQTDGQWKANDVWRIKKFKCGYSNPILYQGHVYGLDENMLACIELATGKYKWKARDGQFGHGQMLLSHDLLLVLGEAGELALVEATPERYHELGRIQAIEGKTWNVPVLVGRRIFVRNHLEMAAYDLPVEEN